MPRQEFSIKITVETPSSEKEIKTKAGTPISQFLTNAFASCGIVLRLREALGNQASITWELKEVNPNPQAKTPDQPKS